jgi:predicted dehydrogenase
LHSNEVSPLLMVGFNRRFAPLARRLQAFFQPRQEALLATYRINAGSIPLNHWVQDPDQGGGRIIGESCHFIDFLTFLVGALPSSISAQALPDDERYREDNVLITLTFPDGSVGSVIYLANGDKTFSKERIEVFSGGRAAALDDFRALELVSHGKRQVLHSRLRQDKGHLAEWEAFCQAVITGSAPPIPYDQLFAVTEATFAALQALRTRQTVALGTTHT